MKKVSLLVAIVILVVWSGLQASASISALSSDALRQLQQDAQQDIDIVWNPQTNTPSFLSGSIPVDAVAVQGTADPGAIALSFARSYADLFGIQQADRELVVAANETDTLGMDHVTLQQVYNGIPVYNAIMKVHIDGQEIVAASNSVAPDIRLVSTEPTVTAADAVVVAQSVEPQGLPAGPPHLVIYTGDNHVPLSNAKLVWIVTLSSPTGLPADYIVDATEPFLLDILEMPFDLQLNAISPDLTQEPLSTHLSLLGDEPVHAGEFPIATYQITSTDPLTNTYPPIATYDSKGQKTFPSTPVRVGSGEPVGNSEVDNAHNFTRETFEYYLNVHGRNSFDNGGAITHSTVNYGTNYVNAFWDGTNKRISYGTGLAVEDVVAHEWTHAVTQHTANLEYRWQSGALNESFSDIFAAMVDREDWLIGEDIPSNLLGGESALRSMSNPEEYGAPGHTDDWVKTCQDQEGVHTNNSIMNKAYYLIATRIGTNEAEGKGKAERIFYRVLSVYLQEGSSFQDTRAAALQATTDLYGQSSAEYIAVGQGFTDVGITSSWNPPENSCSCVATQLLVDRSLFPNALTALNSAATLYQIRADLLSTNPVGQHYRELYEEHSARIGDLVFADGNLLSQATHILTAAQPGLASLIGSAPSDPIITQQDVDDLSQMLRDMAQADRANGGGDLADAIESELERTDLNKVVGMTYTDAWSYLSTSASNTIYLPFVAR